MPPQNYQIVTGVVIATIVFLLAGFFIVILIAYANSRKKKFIQEKQIMQSEFQNELLRTQMEIQEQTFKTISQEIHDNIGQVLSLAKMNLSKFEIDRLNSDEAVLSAKNLVSKAVSDLRDLGDLDLPVVDSALPP